MNQHIHEEAAEWLVELRSRSDDLTRRRFDQWLSTSPEHVRAYLECAAISEVAEASPRATSQEIEALIERARQATGANVVALTPAHSATEAASPKLDARRSWITRSSPRIRFAAAAAMAVVVIGASAGYFMTRNVYTTAVGEQRSILLPDGSTIDMNGRSKVRVRLAAGSRAVELMEGEALFRVAKDKTRPFIVSASDTRVRAVGTEFAVNRLRRELLVTVVDGTVAVSVPTLRSRTAARGAAAVPPRAVSGEPGSVVAALAPASDEVLLNAGQQLAVPTAGSALPQPRSVDVEGAIAWTHRRLVFDSTALEDVVAEFNRHSRRTLVIEGNGLRDVDISGAFSSTDVGPFLRFLRAQPGIEVTEESDRIVIVHR
jgi:transmembrane sensor